MIEEISRETADDLAARLQDHMCAEQLRRFREAFSDEYSKSPLRFEALPAEQRRYFVVSRSSQREALSGIRFRLSEDPPQANISSLARITKDDGAAEGWWYLKRVVEEVLLPKGVLLIHPRAITKGGVKAFEQLRSHCPERNVIDRLGDYFRIGVRTS